MHSSNRIDNRGDLIVLLAASSRAMAAQASAAGYAVISMDNYADLDTAACSQATIKLSDCTARDMNSLQKACSGRKALVIAGGGLEQKTDLLQQLAEFGQWLGVRPKRRRDIEDPVWLYSALRKLGIAMPRTLAAPPRKPAKSQRWLRKPRSGSGGIDILISCNNNNLYNNTNVNNNYCWQQYIEGESWSCTFLACRDKINLLGFCKHIQRPEFANDFRYRGVIAASPSPQWQRQLHQYLQLVSMEVGLLGLVGADFIVGHGKGEPISIIEINPRPTASISLHAERRNLIELHIAACNGLEPDCGESAAINRGEMLYYASSGFAVAGVAVWPNWVHDRPASGSVFEAGDPVCTVSATGRSPDEVVTNLNARVARLDHYFVHT